MDALQGVLAGFEVAFRPENLLFVFLGAFIGTAIGVLPGLGPTATIALLLPITYNMRPDSAIIMLAGIYYGSMYGGTITSVLLKLPGEAASVITTLDGYQMALKGRAGTALSIAAIGSFLGGIASFVGLALLAPPLADLAVQFGPPEYATLTLLGLVLVSRLGSSSVWKSMSSAALGLLLGIVGQDLMSGTNRFTGDVLQLADGIDFVVVAIGLFGVGEILYGLENRSEPVLVQSRLRGMLPSRKDMRRSAGPIARGSILGFGVGLLPGGGGALSSMLSYSTEKSISKHPEEFGKGAIEGVAGPETANNCSSTSAFIPLLTLGLPSNAVLALIFGALLIHGITPGPQLISQEPDVFWGVIVSMLFGNIILLLLNLPLVRIWVQLLKIRMTILGPVAIIVSMVGAYSLANSVFDVGLVVAFGLLGYVMRKNGFDVAPLVIAFVLGPIMERAFRQSLLMSSDGLGIYLDRPFSLGILIAIVVILSAPLIRLLRQSRGRTRRTKGD